MQKLEEFIATLKLDFPASKPELTNFPSGAFMLDITVGPEIFVFEYLPSVGGYGVSRVSTATFGWEGFENVFEDFESAKAFILDLLKGS